MTIKPFQNVVHLCLRCHKQVRVDTKNKLKIHCRCDDKIEPAGKSLKDTYVSRSGIATPGAEVSGKRMPPA